jgi:hypothetical protein
MFLFGCSTTKVLHTELAEGFDLSAYKTFDFYNLDAVDSVTSQFIGRTVMLAQAIEGELKKRGFVRSSANPDIMVNVGIVVEEKVQTRETNFTQDAPRYIGQRRYSWKSQEVEVGRYRVGTATVDLVDSKQNKLVWQGVVEGIIPEKEKKVEATIKKGIALLFAQFPVRQTL